MPGPRPPPASARASRPHAPTYVHTSDHTPVGGDPAPILAREVGTGQAPCAVASRRSGLEPGEPQLSSVSQGASRGQVGGRRSEGTGLEAAGEREGTGLESASHRCFDRQATTYPSIGSTELLLPAQPTPYIYSGGYLPVRHRAAVAMQHPSGEGGAACSPVATPPSGGVHVMHAVAPRGGHLGLSPSTGKHHWVTPATTEPPLPRARGASSDARRPPAPHARARTHAHSTHSPRPRTPSAAGRVSCADDAHSSGCNQVQ
jgi:hypothetical protein